MQHNRSKILKTMMSSRQQAYLEAMGIDTWCLRETPATKTPPADVVPVLKLGPGGGGILLICEADTDSASRLANDIGRALGSVPVWAWPDQQVDGISLSTAIDENMFTTVAIFGRELAAQLLPGEIPLSLGSARLVVLPEMRNIKVHAEAKQVLWTTLCRTGMVTH